MCLASEMVAIQLLQDTLLIKVLLKIIQQVYKFLLFIYFFQIHLYMYLDLTSFVKQGFELRMVRISK